MQTAIPKKNYSVRLSTSDIALVQEVAEARQVSQARVIEKLLEGLRRSRAQERDAEILAACGGVPYPELDGLGEAALSTLGKLD